MTTHSAYRQELLNIIDDISFLRQTIGDLKQENLPKQEYTPLEELEQQALALLEALYELQHGTHRVNVAVVGGFSAGKSSFINSLLGSKVCPVGVGATTSSITTFYYGDKTQIFQEMPHYKDAITEEEYHRRVQHPKNSQKKENISQFSFFYPFDGFRDIELVDTPGFDNKENEHDTQLTLDATKKADVILFILDANSGEISQSVWQTLEKIKRSSKAYWYAFINKADTKPSASLEKIKSKIQEKYGRFFSDIQAYSAQKTLEQQEKSRHQLVQKISDMLDSTIQDLAHQTSQPNAEEPITAIHIHATSKKNCAQFRITRDSKPTDLIEIYQPQKQNYIPRDRVVDVLKQIAEQKNQIATAHFNEMRSSYEHALIAQFRELPRKLAKSASHRQTNPQHRKRIESLFAEIQTVYSQNIKMFSESLTETFTIQPIPKEKKDYWFAPYYEININKPNYNHCWQHYAYIWTQVADSLVEITNAVEQDLQIAIEKNKEHIANKMRNLQTQAKQQIMDGFKYIKVSRILDSYESETAAREAFLSYAKPYEAEIRTILLTSLSDLCSELKQDISGKIGGLKESESHKQQQTEKISKQIEYFLQKRSNRS